MGEGQDVQIEWKQTMSTTINTQFRKSLPGTQLDYFDAREAVNSISPGAYETLPYTSRVLAEQLVRRCDPSVLTDSLKQLIERKRDLDFLGIRHVLYVTTS